MHHSYKKSHLTVAFLCSPKMHGGYDSLQQLVKPREKRLQSGGGGGTAEYRQSLTFTGEEEAREEVVTQCTMQDQRSTVVKRKEAKQ